MTEVLAASAPHRRASEHEMNTKALVGRQDGHGSKGSLEASAFANRSVMQDSRTASQPQDVPVRRSGLPSSFEAARRAVDPSGSPGSGPVYHGRFSRRKNSCDSFGQYGSPGEQAEGAYQGRFGHHHGSEECLSGLNSTGDIQGMLQRTNQYHGRFGDTAEPLGEEEQPGACGMARASSSGRLHGNVMMRQASRLDPFGPDQEYHGPLD